MGVETSVLVGKGERGAVRGRVYIYKLIVFSKKVDLL